MCIAEKPFTKSWNEVQTFPYMLMCTLHHPWLRFHRLLRVGTLSVLDAMVATDAFVPLCILTKIISLCSFLLPNKIGRAHV